MNDQIPIETYQLGTTKCPVCGFNISVYLHVYRAPYGERVAFITSKCDNCGFKYSTVLTLTTDLRYNCLRLIVEKPEDLNTILYIGEDAEVHIPALNIKLSSEQLAIGSIVTVDAILFYIIEHVKNICTEGTTDTKNCDYVEELESILQKGEVKHRLEIIVKSENGVGIIRSYREKNYEVC
jgi:C4-type Zn-finger protein